MKPKEQVQAGDIIHINQMFSGIRNNGKDGVVKFIDEGKRIHGTWGEEVLFFDDDWKIIGESNSEVLDFINRRFSEDCDWLTGNCYYFALILKDRFPAGEIYYDTIVGHFVFQLDNINYDWSGVVSTEGYHYYEKWNNFEEYDSLQKARIIKDCLT